MNRAPALPAAGSRHIAGATVPIDRARIIRERMEAAAQQTASAADRAAKALADATAAEQRARESAREAQRALAAANDAAQRVDGRAAEFSDRGTALLRDAGTTLEQGLAAARDASRIRDEFQAGSVEQRRQLADLVALAGGHRLEAARIATALVGIQHLSVRQQDDGAWLTIVTTDGKILRANVRGPRGHSSAGPAGRGVDLVTVRASDNHLIVRFSDGNVSDAGAITVTGLTQAQADLLYDALGAASAAVAAHVAAGDPHPQYLTQAEGDARYAQLSQVYPVGAIYVSTVGTNPNTLFGFGTWAAFGAGRAMVGLNGADVDFDTSEKTGGAKTVAAAGTNSAPTFAGDALATHSHGVGTLAADAHAGTAVSAHAGAAVSSHAGAAVADHAAHTHSVTSNVTLSSHAGTAVANHASHTHTFTQSSNATTPDLVTALGTGAAVAAAGTTDAPNATLTHTVTQPNDHTVTNNAVTSGNPSATLSHSVTQPSDHTVTQPNNHTVTQPNNHTLSGATAAVSAGTPSGTVTAPTFTGSPTSVVQPYIVVYMFKRTA